MRVGRGVGGRAVPGGRARTWVAALLAVVLALVGLTVAPIPAQAAGTTFVSGVVTADSNGDGDIDTGVAGVADKPIAGAVVRLICDAGSTALASVTTLASGAFSFGDADLGSCAGPVHLEIDTSGFLAGTYATEAAGSANAFDRTSAKVAKTASFTPSTTTPLTDNALLKPAWALDLALAGDSDGYQGKAVYTGSAPFDASGTDDGTDTSAANDKVRTGDTLSYNWSLTASADDSVGDSAKSAVFEQTITLADGAVANFASIPAVCSGTNPASSIVAQPSGKTITAKTVPPTGTTSVVLTCNLGSIGQDRSAIILPTSVWVSSTSANGGQLTTSARAYGVDANGTTTIQPSDGVGNGPIKVTSAPRYNLKKGAFFSVSAGTQTINGVATSGYYFYNMITISTDRTTGIEALKQPVSIAEDFFAKYTSAADSNGSAGSTVSGLKWYLTQCMPSPDGAGAMPSEAVYGNASTAADPTRAVSNSGTCAATRNAADDTSSYTLTFSGIDTSGTHYPTKTSGGQDLSAGPYYVATYRVQIFVPVTEIDKASGAVSDGVGQLSFYNRVGGFDPDGISGASNFGSGTEPGYCSAGVPQGTASAAADCAAMEDATRSDNIAGPATVIISPGSWGKGNGELAARWYPTYGPALLPVSGVWQDGAGQLQPGQSAASLILLRNSAVAAGLSNAALCDVFDNTTAKLTTLDKADAATSSTAPSVSGLYGYVLLAGTSQATNNAAGWAYQQGLQANWKFQYGHVSLGSDDPNTGTFDTGTNRYNGTWTTQKAVNCTSDAITWYDSPDQVPGGIDAINVVRASAQNGYLIPIGTEARMWIALEQRDTYNGGPHDGQSIPAGTVVADFGGVRSDQYLTSGVTSRGYVPQPETGNVDGDRWTVARASMALKKRSITVDGVGSGASDFGNTGTAIAGSQVVWEVVSSLTAASTDPADVQNVTITDTLPKYATYDADCTAGLTGGTPADQVTVNTNGTTTLVWKLGARTPNKTIASRIVCTDTDPLAPNRTALVNTATITADGVTPISAHTDTHTVLLEQTGELKLRKSVDHTLDLQNDTQVYTEVVQNFSDTLKIAAPTVIDVLPYVGDGSSGGVNRSPASDYSGTDGLAGPVTAFDLSGTTSIPGTVYYTTVAGASVPQNLNNDTDPSIWTTSVTDWSKVTGFKFVATTALGTTSSGNAAGITLKYTTAQSANQAGDVYANRFTAFSSTLMNGSKFQLLTSNQTTVRVVAFSLGDLVWSDVNHDQKFTAGVDQPAPKGVKVEVHAADGTMVAQTQTDADGRWVVNDLSRGSYYAVIPASEFATGGPLAGYVAAPGAQTDPNTDKNEDVDHHAIAGTGGSVRSAGTITLDADTSTGEVKGLEPLGDNVAGLKLPSYETDDLTNLTLDLALTPPINLVLTKKLDTTGTVRIGDDVTYTLTPSNDGPGDAVAGWSVTDLLPTGLTLKSMTGTGYTCDLPSATCTATDALAAGTSGKPITVVATVGAGTSGALKNVAWVAPAASDPAPETNPLGTPPTLATDTSTSTTDNDAQASVKVSPLVSIGDFVWWDNNRDGLQSAGEPAYPGMTVELYDAADKLVGTTKTDADGYYAFKDLDASTSYTVTFVAKAGEAFTTQAAGTDRSTDSNPSEVTGEAPVTTPATGANLTAAGRADDHTVDAGVFSYNLTLVKVVATAGPFRQGQQVTYTLTPGNDGPSAARAGWSVTDLLPDGLTLVSMTGDGYVCSGSTCVASAALAPGTTAKPVTVVARIGDTFSGKAHNVAYVAPGTGDGAETVPLVTPTRTTDTDKTATDNDAQADLTVVPKVSVGDLVWLDADHDGIQDAGEKGIAGVTLTLTGPDGKSVTDVFGKPVGTVTTDADGHYSFANLPVLADGKSYTVTVTPPSGYLATISGVGDRATDSSTGSAASQGLNADGQRDATLDFGFWAATPSMTIAKKDAAGNDADSADTKVVLTGGSTGLVFTITNSGNEPLVDLAVTDKVTGSGTVSNLVCTFPDGSSGTTWKGPFAVGATFGCTAELTGVTSELHTDTATVAGTGQYSLTSVTGTNPYNAVAAKVVDDNSSNDDDTDETTTINTGIPGSGSTSPWLAALGGLLVIAGLGGGVVIIRRRGAGR